MNGNFIPASDAGFDGFQRNLLGKVASRAPALNIPLEAVAALQALQGRWATAYAAAEDPETRTKATVKTKQAIRKEFETELRKFCKPYLTYNPAVTDADRENFGLPVHKTTRTPVPVATTPPDYELELSVPGRITFHFFEKGGKHAEAKPFGQHGAEIGWSLGGERPARWQDLSHSSFDTHSPLTLSFENDQRGQPLYFALRWENTRGEKGPWSEIQETMVP